MANSVWSVPRPMLVPGLKRVPRCRTMMLPAVTNCPPKRLTPSRWELESRPLPELPTPFLCAIALCLDLGDANGAHRLPVSAVSAVVLPALELDLEDRVALRLGHHFPRHLGGGQRLGLYRHLPVIADKEDLLELHGRASRLRSEEHT